MFAHFVLGLSQVFAISKINFKKWGEIVFSHFKKHTTNCCVLVTGRDGALDQPDGLSSFRWMHSEFPHVYLSLGRRKGGWNRSLLLLKERFHIGKQLPDISFCKIQKTFFKAPILKVMLWNLRGGKGNASQAQFCKWLPGYSLWKGTKVLPSWNCLLRCWF